MPSKSNTETTGFAAVGPLVLGTLSDYVSPWLLAVITATLSCISTLVLWGALGIISALMAFGATYGLFAGGWSTLYTGFVRGITGELFRHEWTMKY